MHFLNSLARPDGREVEWIGDGAALRRWLGESAVGSGEEAADASIEASDGAAAAARRFRDWFGGFVEAHAGRPLPEAAQAELGPLNDLLREQTAHRAVGIADGRPAWKLERRLAGARALLQPIAEAAGDLICDADFARVRRCEGPGCTIWFLDRTKGGRRRWCSMAACGNRAKAKTHRDRARAASPPADGRA